jgi:hypothetical protein
MESMNYIVMSCRNCKWCQNRGSLDYDDGFVGCSLSPEIKNLDSTCDITIDSTGELMFQLVESSGTLTHTGSDDYWVTYNLEDDINGNV